MFERPAKKRLCNPFTSPLVISSMIPEGSDVAMLSTSNRCPKVFLSAVAPSATVIFWLGVLIPGFVRS